METDDNKKELRTKAEARLKSFPDLSKNPSIEEVKFLLHELRVYQVELEMQNEELRQAQHRLEKSRDQYTDLFEFAPLGYFILDRNGVILNANLTGCRLLGVERSRLINKPFSLFVAREQEAKRRFWMYLKKVFESSALQSCELELQRKNGADFTARLDTKVITDESDTLTHCRMSVNDIAGEKKTEALLDLTKQLQTEKDKLRKSELSTMEAILQAQEKERSRIAADLHDGINPLLSMARLNADALRSQGKKMTPLEKDRLDNIVDLLKSAMREIKLVSANLSPAVLKDFGLLQALEYLCKYFEESSGIRTAFRSHGIDEEIPSKIELNLYRIAQELLNNILKHADASEIEVQLIRHPISIVLMVEDNGVGFDQAFELLISNGFGFKNIASRVRLLNGRMDIDSTPEIGTTITIELPL